MSRSKFYFVFSTGAVVPNTGDGISEKNISSLAWGSRHRILKARLGTLETCHSVFMRDCSQGLCCVHEGLCFPPQFLESAGLTSAPAGLGVAVPAGALGSDRDKTTPVVGCSGAVSDLAGKRRLILGAVRLVLFVSARGGVVRLLSLSVVMMLRLPLRLAVRVRCQDLREPFLFERKSPLCKCQMV